VFQLMGGGWSVVYNAGGSMARVSDPTAPVSPPYVLQWKYPAGHASGGGVGNLVHDLAGNASEVYVAFSMWHDSNFEWNSISNKMLYLEPGNILVESQVYGQALVGYIGSIGGIYYPSIVQSWPMGGWASIEVQIRRGTNGLLRVWKNGVLVLDRALSIPTTTSLQELKLDTTWGGQTGPKTRDSYRRIDHVFVATP